MVVGSRLWIGVRSNMAVSLVVCMWWWGGVEWRRDTC